MPQELDTCLPEIDTYPPRLRFAPSPTGIPHLGTARTALFNWLYARGHSGEVLLRIEDTNENKTEPEYVDAIFDMLAWLEIDYDRAPTYQSHNAHLYDDAIEQLTDNGYTYTDKGALRFRTPKTGVTSFHDRIKGTMTFENSAIEDFVLRRTDGGATFYLANAVDDLSSGVTHVIRGEDLLVTTPKVLMVRSALGAIDAPVFAHLPLLVNEERKKLAKRHDDVSLMSYKTKGILPQAMVNYLALLGWGPPDNIEMRPIGEIIDLFDLEGINSSPAMFATDKLISMNGAYIRELGDREFADKISPWVKNELWGTKLSSHDLTAIAPLVKERTRVLSDVPDRIAFLYTDHDYDKDDWSKTMTGPAADILEDSYEALQNTKWESSCLYECIKSIGESYGMKLGKAQAPIRIAITGRSIGPPLFESMELLGRDETLKRIRNAIDRLIT